MTFKLIADEERYSYVTEVPKAIRENYVIAEGESNTYKVKLQRRYQSCNRHRCTRSDCHSMHTALSLFQGITHFFLFRKDPFCLLCCNPSTIIQRDSSSGFFIDLVKAGWLICSSSAALKRVPFLAKVSSCSGRYSSII